MIARLHFKHAFFDRAVVQGKVAPEVRKGMNRFGGYVRRTARSSIKRRGDARKPPKNVDGKAYQRWLAERRSRPRSAPGAPPFMHTANPVANPKNIQYAWDGAMSVIIGMAGVRGRRGKPLPHQIEFGSEQILREDRTRLRKIGDGGEIEIGRKVGGTTKMAYATRLGNVAVSYARLLTERQVARANQLNQQLYGQAARRTSTAPRPVITPAFGLAVAKFGDAFAGALIGSA